MKLSYILNSYTREDIHLMSSLTSRQKLKLIISIRDALNGKNSPYSYFCLHNQFANSPRLLNSERDYNMNLVDLDKNHSNLDMNKPHNILVQPGVDLNNAFR